MQLVSDLFYNQLADFVLVHLVALTGGILATRFGWKVNYVRKINHFFVFFSPYLIRPLFPYQDGPYTQVWLAIVGISTLAIYIKPIRNNVHIVQLMFASFDRPEDRPHTLKWLFTQYLATYLVALPLWMLFRHTEHTQAMPIIVLINALGDGLAEPVGVTWGRHKYKVRALFTDAPFQRSFEGSACVFVVSVLALLFYRDGFTQTQFWVAMFAVPVISTLAEAKSPHTWDSPVIFGATGLTLVGIYMI